MRVVYFSRDYTVHDHRFLKALAETDHSIYFLQLERGRGPVEDRPLPAGIEQVQWAGGLAPANWQDGFRLLASLKQVIREIKPDLIHAGPIQRSAFLAALTGFHPLISMSWGYDLIFDARRNPFWRWATRYALEHSDAMIGDCDAIRRLAISNGMHPDHIVTFPWGIDLEHFHPGEDNHKDQSVFTLLSTRSWEPIYGVDLIARAFVQAAQFHPELSLVMLGSGSQAGGLRRIFDQGGVSEQVFMPGAVRQAELPRYYRQADLYISASHSDGTSISLLEAMACGCPVLLSDIPGNLEWVKPGENGWVFPDGDAQALAQAIVTAVGKRRELASMGRCAREIVEARGDWKKNFPKLLQVYAQFAHSSKS